MSLACCLGLLLQKFFLFSNVILPSKLSLMFHSVVFPVKIKQQTTKQIKTTRYLNFLFAYICLLASKYRESFFDDKIIKKKLRQPYYSKGALKGRHWSIWRSCMLHCIKAPCTRVCDYHAKGGLQSKFSEVIMMISLLVAITLHYQWPLL